jgi:hypothetical protein
MKLAYGKDICRPMFVAAVFKIWNQHKCPSMDEWKGNMACT